MNGEYDVGGNVAEDGNGIDVAMMKGIETHCNAWNLMDWNTFLGWEHHTS